MQESRLSITVSIQWCCQRDTDWPGGGAENLGKRLWGTGVFLWGGGGEGVSGYLNLWALSKQGVEVHPLWGGPRGQQILEYTFSSSQHLRCGAVVVSQLQCLSPCQNNFT